MKSLKMMFSRSQIKALLKKDILVRWRQPWMSIVQIVWPCLIFMLLYTIRLKYGPEHIDDCQFPARLLPTTHNVVPSFYDYICTIENKCSNTSSYKEYEKWDNAPMKPIIDIVQIFITDDRMYNAVVELPEKANFISAVTTVVTGGRMNDIRQNVEKVIGLVPEVEKYLNGSFDVKKLFSDRKTFVKAGYLLCGHPFPNTEVIPLVNDILYSEDFSNVNDDELKVMPTKYCKQLYRDITTNNYGKITWNTIKPLIHGKILYSPVNDETNSIMKFTNTTFEELNRLKQLSTAMYDILTKLREDESFQNGFNSLIKLAQSPIVKSLVGDEIDIDQIEAVINRIRTDPVIYDVITTIKNILECLSVDRFVPVPNEQDLRMTAFEMNKQRLFYAAINFKDIESPNIEYKFHMDIDNTQPTFENANRFWFPGPSKSMLRDMKYHKGFVQIKQSLDLAIIKHKKEKLHDLGLVTERITTKSKNPVTVQILTGDENDDDLDNTDDWFSESDSETTVSNQNNMEDMETTTKSSELISNFFDGLERSNKPEVSPKTSSSIELDDKESGNKAATIPSEAIENSEDILNESNDPLTRVKRQGLLDLFSSFFDTESKGLTFDVDKLQFYTKQYPYPAYTDDDFKTGIYLAQAIQCAFFLGLVAQISSSVRHLIWMRESHNSMIMRAMGLKSCSEMTSWVIVTFIELFLIFIAVTVILYSGGILQYTGWFFIMVFLFLFGACLIAFCYMCSTFFSSATLGSVATSVLFFISFCPYIIVLLFDAHLNSLENFGISLSFTTAFSHAWSHVMRTELQETGLTFATVFDEGFKGEFGFGAFMLILDTILYVAIGQINLRYKKDDNRFIVVQREDLDISLGATMTNVSKIYDENKIAVSNISLSFPRDQVTCLLGRNGAGKSTIIKMLTGQVVQTTGRVILSQAMSNSIDYDNIGVCAQDNILIPNLTAREHLEMYAKIKLKHDYQSEVEKTLHNLNFGKHEKYMASQLSGGYQRRLCVAIAFIGSPNVVILDEPCNGVDAKARKDIWDLIENLRKGRAVIFATHYLDEAEYLSDNIIVMKNGKIIAKHSPETMKDQCTASFTTKILCASKHISDAIVEKAEKLFTPIKIIEKSDNNELSLEISYDQPYGSTNEFLKYLQNLEKDNHVSDLSIESENLEELFRSLDSTQNGRSNGHTQTIPITQPIQLKKDMNMDDLVRVEPLTNLEAIKEMFWKRFVHFSRNYRMLLCVLVLPAIFEILAMWFVAFRVEDDFDKVISLNRNLYPNSIQSMSLEQPIDFTRELYDQIKADCNSSVKCMEFNNSQVMFKWILESLNEYQGKRYGSYSFNGSRSFVWYNNKGYHAMMAWLNDLNSFYLQSELNDTSYKITAYNEPWKLGTSEFSTTSILRQAGDSCMVFIFVIAYSLVVAVASVYLVNERVKGEKLQQKLCGVTTASYWGVAFAWDFLIIILAVMVCTAIILAFGMPVFVDRQQLWGLIVLSLFFGFACIPMVHVFEKLFNESSKAIVTIFSMNVIIPLFTLAVIVLLGVIGDSKEWDDWRYFLNRLFLIFPQHALGDGLIELSKNYMVALSFRRYDIDSYKNPVNSDLLENHLIALAVLGVFFSILNFLIESGLAYRGTKWLKARINCCNNDEDLIFDDFNITSIQNSLRRSDKFNKTPALEVKNLYKSYRRGLYAVKGINFSVDRGECFGLLGKNGAGKSTIFKMLSGEMESDIGTIHYENDEISYCPQTNTLDSLLTVEECLEFYGHLRRIKDIPKVVDMVLETYQLEAYRNVLVKNLSGGNRRKLTVATTCLGNTSVVLMDEPTSDMDPVTRALVYHTIDMLLEQKRAIVLTSHTIAEIENICHRIAVLKDGQIFTCCSPESLKAQFGGFYSVALFTDSDKLEQLEKEIKLLFPQHSQRQRYAHSIKFSIKIKSTKSNDIMSESEIDVPSDIAEVTPLNRALTLSELFQTLEELKTSHIDSLRYAVNRCRLDTVFESLLDSSNGGREAYQTPPTTSSSIGSPSLGYIHNGYVDTEKENETAT